MVFFAAATIVDDLLPLLLLLLVVGLVLLVVVVVEVGGLMPRVALKMRRPFSSFFLLSHFAPHLILLE